MMKCIKKVLKNFTLRADLFSAAATLRHRGQPTYQSLCGGIFSILIVIGFAVIFFQSFVDIINKVQITSEIDLQESQYNTYKIDNLQFAVGIEDIDFSQTYRYFEIVATHKSKPLGHSQTQTIITLQTCNIDDWKDIGVNFEQLYSVYNLDTLLCPKQGELLQLQGFKGSDTWQTIQLKVQKCVNQTGVSWVCHPTADINNFVTNYQATNDFLEFHIYLVDTIFTPQQSVPSKKVIEEQIFYSFTNDLGSRGKIKLGYYNITTDESIWPYSVTTQQFGHYITGHSVYATDIVSSHLVKVQIQKDQTVYQIERTYGKIQDMLSYVGGLFSLLFVFFLFFIGSYSEYKYELSVAQKAFTVNQTGEKVRDDDFNFFTYIKYSIYDWIDAIGCKIKWKTMEKIHQARTEATEQLDVRLLIRRIERLQSINQILLNQRNLMCAQLSQPPTLEKIKKMRKIVQYYDKVIKQPQTVKNNSSVVPMPNIQDQHNIDTLSNEHNFYQKKYYVQKQKQDLSDFDSDDEKIQRQIVESYRRLHEYKNEYTEKIWMKIPKRMKRRLNIMQQKYSRISSPQRQQKKDDQISRISEIQLMNTKSDKNKFPKQS